MENAAEGGWCGGVQQNQKNHALFTSTLPHIQITSGVTHGARWRSKGHSDVAPLCFVETMGFKKGFERRKFTAQVWKKVPSIGSSQTEKHSHWGGQRFLDSGRPACIHEQQRVGLGFTKASQSGQEQRSTKRCVLKFFQ